MTADRVRVAVVGTGRWAQVAHLPSRPAQGDFGQGALVQETINAFEQSFRSRAWVSFPLAEPSADGAPAPAIGTAAP